MKACQVIAALACATVATIARAQLHATDVALKQENGRLVTGRVDPTTGTAQFPWRLFTTELGDPLPNTTTEPGFDSEAGALPAGTVIGISIRRALRVWDGHAFEAIPVERVEIIRAQTIATPPADPPLCHAGPGVALGLTSPTGHLHVHPAYRLTEPGAPGVYLLELEAWRTEAALGVSEPFWLILGQNESGAAIEAAEAWVLEVLLCPADFNRDGALSVSDYIAFQTAFALGAGRADFNGDCAHNVNDYIAFQTAFALGCP